MLRILMTGFEPFGGQTINPSWQAVQGVTAPDGVELIRRELPVRWHDTADAVETLLNRFAPEAILLTGQAGGTDRIRVERVGLNLRDAASPDNAGVVVRDEPIFRDAPAAYFSTFAYREILHALTAAYSFSAGAYLCNEALYTALHLLPQAQCGFIHLPFLPEQTASCFSLPLERQIEALNRALDAQVAAMRYIT